MSSLQGQTCNQWINKASRADAQHSDDRPLYCIINFTAAKTVDLNCSHHKREMKIM